MYNGCYFCKGTMSLSEFECSSSWRQSRHQGLLCLLCHLACLICPRQLTQAMLPACQDLKGQTKNYQTIMNGRCNMKYDKIENLVPSNRLKTSKSFSGFKYSLDTKTAELTTLAMSGSDRVILAIS